MEITLNVVLQASPELLVVLEKLQNPVVQFFDPPTDKDVVKPVKVETQPKRRTYNTTRGLRTGNTLKYANKTYKGRKFSGPETVIHALIYHLEGRPTREVSELVNVPPGSIGAWLSTYHQTCRPQNNVKKVMPYVGKTAEELYELL